MWTDIAAAILVGGHGRRLGGRDKARLPSAVAPLSLLERLVAELRPAVAETFLVGRTGQLFAEVDCPLVIDRRPESGPLAAVETALGHATAPWCFVLACDLPAIDADLLGRLVEARLPESEVVLFAGPAGLEPVCALYRTSLARSVSEGLDRGDRALHRWLSRRALTRIELDANEEQQLLNLNDPPTLARYLETIGGRPSEP